MSDLESSDDDGATPNASTIEQCLRRVVRDAMNAGDEITVNMARTSAEDQLGLDTGFFKDNAEWKQRSKDIISSAVDEPGSPVKPKMSVSKPKTKAGAKRKSIDAEKAPKKRRKRSPVAEAEDDDDDAFVEEEVKPKAKAKGRRAPVKKARAVESEDELEEKKSKAKPARKRVLVKKARTPESEDVNDGESATSPAIKGAYSTKESFPDEGHDAEASTVKPAADDSEAEAKKKSDSALSDPPETDSAAPPASKQNGKATAKDDDSDLSSVRDDPAPKKKRQKKSTCPSETKSSKPAKPKPPANDLSPDEAKIKDLQSWLLKCGVRKLWHRELAPFPTPKAKLSHLKSMLEDVGMTGRYSAEKARGIKEKRELAAELEAAKEFSQQWGHKGDGSGSGSEGEGGRTRRLVPRGLVDFGASGDEGSD